ncbi:MAG TPA: hypothetical protein VFL47_17530 [Flavisolibacter sp.]|nr:hypothetical protein [Flavisolibacter sp.]
MEFFCVLSVSGSLASYQVKREQEDLYEAVLWANNGQRDDIPAEFTVKKEGSNWHVQPWHDEIANGLIRAIEANGHP